MLLTWCCSRRNSVADGRGVEEQDDGRDTWSRLLRDCPHQNPSVQDRPPVSREIRLDANIDNTYPALSIAASTARRCSSRLPRDTVQRVRLGERCRTLICMGRPQKRGKPCPFSLSDTGLSQAGPLQRLGERWRARQGELRSIRSHRCKLGETCRDGVVGLVACAQELVERAND